MRLNTANQTKNKIPKIPIQRPTAWSRQTHAVGQGRHIVGLAVTHRGSRQTHGWLWPWVTSPATLGHPFRRFWVIFSGDFSAKFSLKIDSNAIKLVYNALKIDSNASKLFFGLKTKT
jgi:hypothetical protein